MFRLRYAPLLPVAALVATALVTAGPTRAEAFCGFYVSGASGDLVNNATMVVLMRDGQRTIQSMQNSYQGPPEDFAMVVPVPVVLKEENVKTLDKAIFAKVDAMASPRLVEYWEQDPCAPPMPVRRPGGALRGRGDVDERDSSAKKESFVKIEAQFTVGEYEIVILSASDSSALDGWLKTNRYNVPPGARDAYQPYIEGGMYFFVARVNVKKVKFEDGRAVLSPLRFHYDAKDFNLPVRLGLVNAEGQKPQDLIVHILARNQRYEVGNYKNVAIPTNVEVADEVRTRFGEFYAALFDKTLANHPGSVVTEYAWDAATCDPCPGPNLTGGDFLTLGADTLPDKPQYGFVLTRLHARYTKETLRDDLTFKAAGPIAGGREFYKAKGQLERGTVPSPVNNFQGRYIIRHPWTGPVTCDNPNRGVWGGPPGGSPHSGPAPGKVTPAANTAFAPRGKLDLKALVRTPILELNLDAPTSATTPPAKEEKPAKDAPQVEAEAKVEPGGLNMEAQGGSGSAAEAPPASAPSGSQQSCGVAAHTRGGASGLLALLLLTLGAAWARRRAG